MSWFSKLFGASETIEGGVKVVKPGYDRQKAATSFAVEAAKGASGTTKYAFVFRTKSEAITAGANYAKETKEFMVSDPWVELYSDGTCNLFFVLQEEVTNAGILALARSIKTNGGLGFMASRATRQIQNQLLDLFGLKRAVRVGL
jgi:hypothetical protein